VDRLLTRPVHSDSEPTEHAGRPFLSSRVRGMRATFGPAGFTATPALGKAAQGAPSVRFQLASVTVADEPIAFSEADATRALDDVILDHGSVREVYHVTLDGVEQTFVFDALPTHGDLVVQVDVQTEMAVSETAEAIRFHCAGPDGADLGGVTYGRAFVLDAAGRRQAIERTWTGGSIQLHVPAAFLASAVFPVTIDPPVNSFISMAGAPDDSSPDLCFAGGNNLYWSVFEDYVNATAIDIYAISFDDTGDIVDFITVATSTEGWTAPKIAYHAGSDRCLVVGSAIDSGGLGSIRGRLIDCAAGTVLGSTFQISTLGALKAHPDVGGNNFDSLTSSHFLVAWSTVWNPGLTHQIEYRVVDWDGTFVTAVTQATDFPEVHNEPCISATHGDADLIGDYWTMVWTHDEDNSGTGQILARRVVWSGNSGLGAGNFVVESDTNCSHPRVTSRFNRPLLHINDRPSLVVYEKTFGSANGPQRSLYSHVITDGAAEVESPISFQLEDFDSVLDQFEPDVACDGNCFYITYTETFWGNPTGPDHDMYMLSGCITDRLNGAEIALAERHELMAFSSSAERTGVVATVWDGEVNSTSDDGLALWEDQNVTNGATLEGASLEIPTVNQSLSRAVGRQFCDANPNSGGGAGGRQASWSWLQGDQSVGSTHTYRATDLPQNTFGYAIIGTTFSNINNPAGSLGRVCVTGGGRYVDQIASSGTNGTLRTTINPMSDHRQGRRRARASQPGC
ncbi:MAG: hypothetical protein AAGG01_20035, partial [Planctomycetota bacterium]